MRVAAVDLGTNTTRLLVADVDDGRVEPIVRREAITRLGESVDRRRVLLPTAIARVRASDGEQVPQVSSSLMEDVRIGG